MGFLSMDNRYEFEEEEHHHFAMNAGDGPLSYLQNSSYQRGVLEVAKPIIQEEIATKLEISRKQKSFCIADFGCSTGSNSFPAMQMIIDAVKRKHQSSELKTQEFFVLFNDVVSNDFNTLFTSLPADRNYKAAAVAGDFHRRLLPPSSLHFAYSCWSLHWLTEVPKAVLDPVSPAWNRGEIFYTRERREVCDAYLDQFDKDFESFLNSRAVEMVDGGVMAVLVPGVPAAWDPEKEFTFASVVELLRSSLMDIAREGRLSKAEIDSFNIPNYFPTPQQLKAILQRSHSFSTERMETLNTGALLTPQGRAACIRAVYEDMLTAHFGGQIIDELFDLYEKKLAASPVFGKPDNDKTIVLLAILKRIIVS